MTVLEKVGVVVAVEDPENVGENVGVTVNVGVKLGVVVDVMVTEPARS